MIFVCETRFAVLWVGKWYQAGAARISSGSALWKYENMLLPKLGKFKKKQRQALDLVKKYALVFGIIIVNNEGLVPRQSGTLIQFLFCLVLCCP